MKKADRIWSQRSEAIAILAAHPNCSAEQAIGMLFQSTRDSIEKDVTAARRGIVDAIRAQRAREDALLAQAAAQDAKDAPQAPAQKPAVDVPQAPAQTAPVAKPQPQPQQGRRTA